MSGLEKSAVQLSRTSRFSCWASHFSFSLAQWARAQESHCQLNCKKRNLRLAQGKKNLRATCPKGKLEFKFFLSPDSLSGVRFLVSEQQSCEKQETLGRGRSFPQYLLIHFSTDSNLHNTHDLRKKVGLLAV